MESKHSFEWIDTAILLSTWEGPITRESFKDTTLERLELSRDLTTQYVLVIDMRNATNKIMDMQLNKWAVKLDPKLHSVIVVTKGKMAELTMGTLSKLISPNMSYVTSLDEAIELARTAVEPAV